MTPKLKPLLLAVLLAGATLGAAAQPAGGQGHPGGMHQRLDPARMQEMHARRQAELKAQLKLSPAQEAAWSAFTAAMQPPADLRERMGPEQRGKMREEMAALTTPERLARMEQMKARRDAEMARRHDATRTFYAALTPEQQKVFDTATVRGGRHGAAPGQRMRHHHG